MTSRSQSLLRGLGLTVLLSTLAPAAAAQTTYAFDLWGTLYEVDFGAVSATPLGSTGLTAPYGIAQSPNPDSLYVAVYNDGLYEVDKTTFSTTPLGAGSPTANNLARNEDNGLLYANDWSSLYSVDPTSAAMTLVGSFGGPRGMYGFDYHRGLGTLIGSSAGPMELYSIDINTGVATPIGFHGISQIVGLWYDEASGRTFGVTDINGSGTMVEFDVTTGSATVLGTTGVNFVSLGGEPGGLNLGTAYCFGDGSGTTCPCGNMGGAGEGCANSSGAGAVATLAGSLSVALDDLQVHATNLLPSQPALLFAGQNTPGGGNGTLFGDGLRCVGMNVVRLGVQVPDAQGDATWGPGLGASGGWANGDTRYLQVWYRDPVGSPCGASFNLSNGIAVTFLP